MRKSAALRFARFQNRDSELCAVIYMITSKHMTSLNEYNNLIGMHSTVHVAQKRYSYYTRPFLYVHM